jgi:acyl-CoA synthetase (AMP-forming)/AMP-acid ligase II
MTQRMDYGSVTPALGREKDVIIRGAFIISPIEIERALLSHPLVRDAAVFGAPDPVPAVASKLPSPPSTVIGIVVEENSLVPSRTEILKCMIAAPLRCKLSMPTSSIQ